MDWKAIDWSELKLPHGCKLIVGAPRISAVNGSDVAFVNGDGKWMLLASCPDLARIALECIDLATEYALKQEGRRVDRALKLKLPDGFKWAADCRSILRDGAGVDSVFCEVPKAREDRDALLAAVNAYDQTRTDIITITVGCRRY